MQTKDLVAEVESTCPLCEKTHQSYASDVICDDCRMDTPEAPTDAEVESAYNHTIDPDFVPSGQDLDEYWADHKRDLKDWA